MADLVVHPQAEPLRGKLPAPPDAAATEIALLLGALAPRGATSRLAGRGLPPLAAAEALRRLGLEVSEGVGGVAIVAGPFRAPATALPCPSAPAPMGLLAGLLAAQPFSSVIDDAMGPSMRRAMDGAARALRARGGSVEGTLDAPGVLGPPVTIAPAPLSELGFEVEAGAVAAKAAALGSGLFADGPTFVGEAIVSDDRCERQLAARGADLASVGPMLRLAPLAAPLPPIEGVVPGDPALAAVLAAAALAIPESLVGLGGLTVSPSRSGWIEALRDGGAHFALQPLDDALGEATADLHLRGERPRRLRLAAERGQRAGVSLTVLASIAALAEGESELFDVPLRHDREIDDILGLLGSFGIEAARAEAGLVVRGASRPLPAAEITAPDGVGAMAAAVLALAANGPSRIRNATGIVATFPRFVGCLRALGACIHVQS